MGIEQLLDPSKEFLVVRHRVLNHPLPAFGEEAEQIRKELKGCTGGREIVPVFEGDYFFPSWSGVILAHGSFGPGEQGFRALREQGLAACVEEVLDAYRAAQNHLGKVALCFEAKLGTPNEGTRELLRILATDGIRNAYIDSFFGFRLWEVWDWNQDHVWGEYLASLHLAATAGPVCVGMPMTLFPKHRGCDVITVPYATAFGSRMVRSVPRIYGAVTSKEAVARAAGEENVIGVYWRGEEKNSFRTFVNSFGRSKIFGGNEKS